MVFTVYLKKSDLPKKKYMVKVFNKWIHFGAKGYSDFTRHKNLVRKKAYFARHSVNENWSFSGIQTAGFWSRWILWNKDTLGKSIKDTERRFNIKIIRQ